MLIETKVETTGEAVRLELTPDRTTIKADGEDLAVFKVAAYDSLNRLVPVAQNKVHFGLEGAGKIIGVGNGDPSCHEPDTFVPQVRTRTVALSDWRWKQGKHQAGSGSRPEYAVGFDDADWNVLSAASADWPRTIEGDDVAAVYRARFTVTDEELRGGAQIIFSGCDDAGWYFVNGEYVGETHEWNATPAYDISRFLRRGDNVIAVLCMNGGGQGGLNPNVTIDIARPPEPVQWSRSLFNGLAQVIVKSTSDAGTIKLIATAEGLAPATTTVRVQPGTRRPFVP
jgi:beta-galactosidase